MTPREAVQTLTHTIQPYDDNLFATVELYSDKSNRPVYGVSGIDLQRVEEIASDLKGRIASTVLADAFHDMDHGGPALFYDYERRDGTVSDEPVKLVIVTHDAWTIGGQVGSPCWLKYQCFEFQLKPISATGVVRDRHSSNHLEPVSYADILSEHPAIARIMDIQVADRYLDALKAAAPSPKI
jgi:hypothetical protein